MTFDFLISLLRVVRWCGRAEVSTIVVVTLSGVPMDGGIVIWGRVGCILVVTKISLTRELACRASSAGQIMGIPREQSYVIKLDLPAPSSPQTQMRTVGELWHDPAVLWGAILPVAITMT